MNVPSAAVVKDGRSSKIKISILGGLSLSSLLIRVAHAMENAENTVSIDKNVM